MFKSGRQEEREKKIKAAAEADSLKQVEYLLALEAQKQADSIRNALVKKAYKSANFGMTTTEVKQLDDFKEKSYSYLGDYYEKIGTQNYTVDLHYYNDTLYAVEITTPKSSDNGFRSATALSTSIRDEIENLKDIFIKTYGDPTINTGVPRIFELSAGDITWAYIWIIDTKRIKIGIYESFGGARYRTVAQIYHDPTNTRILNIQKNEEERKKNEDANKL